MTSQNSYFKNDFFSQSLGIELIQAEDNYAKTLLALSEKHINGLGTVHGAVIFSLADITFATACNSGSSVSIGTQAQIQYFSKVTGRTLYAEAKLISSSSKIAYYQVNVRDEQNLIAQLSGTAYKLPPVNPMKAKGQTNE